MAYVKRSDHGLDSGREVDWQQEGVCGTGKYHPDLWTSPVYTDLGQARWVCLRECPVQRHCAAWAVANPEQAEGSVYGGYYHLTLRLGRSGVADHQPALLKPGTVPMMANIRQPGKGGRPRATACGTYAGYRYHGRHDTDPCDPCLEAAAEYRQRELARKRARKKAA